MKFKINGIYKTMRFPFLLLSAEKIQSAKDWVKIYYGERFIGDELAKNGYVCLSTDMLNWSDRGGAGYVGQQALASNLKFNLVMQNDAFKWLDNLLKK